METKSHCLIAFITDFKSVLVTSGLAHTSECIDTLLVTLNAGQDPRSSGSRKDIVSGGATSLTPSEPLWRKKRAVYGTSAVTTTRIYI